MYFSEEEKRQMYNEIAQFFKEEHDLDLGIIGTGNIFSFFREMFENRIYNKALDDAKKFYAAYAENMESDFYALYRDLR